MTDLFHLAFAYQNLIPTILLIIIIVYWLSVILGAIDLDSIDFDIDVDLDMEADTDIDIDSHSISWLNQILSFFHLGKVPFMIWLSIVAMPLWLLTIAGNAYFVNESFWMGCLIMLPILFVSLFIGKYVSWPLIPLFDALDKGDENINIPGKRCRIITPPAPGKVGQAEIEHNTSFILVYVYSEEHFQKNDLALIIEKHALKDQYLISHYEDPI